MKCSCGYPYPGTTGSCDFNFEERDPGLLESIASSFLRGRKWYVLKPLRRKDDTSRRYLASGIGAGLGALLGWRFPELKRSFGNMSLEDSMHLNEMLVAITQAYLAKKQAVDSDFGLYGVPVEPKPSPSPVPQPASSLNIPLPWMGFVCGCGKIEAHSSMFIREPGGLSCTEALKAGWTCNELDNVPTWKCPECSAAHGRCQCCSASVTKNCHVVSTPKDGDIGLCDDCYERWVTSDELAKDMKKSNAPVDPEK